MINLGRLLSVNNIIIKQMIITEQCYVLGENIYLYIERDLNERFMHFLANIHSTMTRISKSSPFLARTNSRQKANESMTHVTHPDTRSLGDNYKLHENLAMAQDVHCTYFSFSFSLS